MAKLAETGGGLLLALGLITPLASAALISVMLVAVFRACAADPVRVFQEFATLDLISHGCAEIVAGRGSSIEAYPLFGFDLVDYDSLFSEKLDLLLKIRENTHVHWPGKHRAPLTGQAVYPRPLQNPLPIWIGVAGTPASFARAGALGLPLMVTIIGGEPKRFRPLIDLYREAGRHAGHSAEKLIVGLHAIDFLGETHSRLPRISIPDMPTRSPRSATNAAGLPRRERNLKLSADLLERSLTATPTPWLRRCCT
jgi:alkanesulfonate monooxygenase SsuD/methylene tetrahydromethanopterin reductase-like flavin-dependent oxidoreductase (luciferase family)